MKAKIPYIANTPISIECYRNVNGKATRQQKSLWDEVAYIFDDSTTSESAISRCMRLFTVDRKEIDKSIKP